MDDTSQRSAESADIQRLRKRWNNFPTMVGVALWFGPMSHFWIRFLPPLRPFDFDAPAPPGTVFAAGVAVCLVPYALPRSYFFPIAFERGRLYPRLGVRLFRFLAPDGNLINRRLRKHDPNYRVIRTRTELRDHIRSGFTGERTHLAFLLAGLLTAFFAVTLEEVWLAAIVTVGNVVFNLYPVMHQRYKRARLRASWETAEGKSSN